MVKTVREQTWDIEDAVLSPLAAHSRRSAGRLRSEPECSVRTVYQRDRDRIIHSNAFRRLKHKTQVFLSPEGDHYRTRLTHTLEVSQIARTIARGLRLNEDLAEAVALGHDLGHTPFGHAGEAALNAVVPGGFRHYEQSLRVVDVLEKDGEGLNLTREVRDGIERHTSGTQPATLEGRIVRLADRIAYINHDIDDAIHADVLSETAIPEDIRAALGNSKSQRISTLVISAIENSGEDIRLGQGTQAAFDQLHDFMFDSVYKNDKCKDQEPKAMELVKWLYDFFKNHPEELPPGFARIAASDGAERAACDYIAGMTDRYAVMTFNKLFIPKSWEY
ncbi:MAG TPA: deoxyguanosinetriphosphate triphosphohydrolase [Clostridiales bacterium]|nr:MAG: Deoxyguanosinetriphosphate triphosphohydrolase [Firmicutes bacterium ADurb.Bin262]HOU10914.1 deoxyguanosinetriphosphate triphosphohydrolase [Clostridiales bacterium]HQH62271.1 deoxyguanosinetriphosphate triphosphohydrolase [Clostridiales bacterium]HQK74485.1 deoxyguanosinetriphosphate triphosphohydrolase [Clostridiales bacterium]